MRKLIISLIILETLFLIGCFANVKEVRDNPSKRIDFEVKKNYQEAHRTILNQIRNCSAQTWGTQISSDLYTDIKKGTISEAVNGPLGTLVSYIVDVAYVSDNSSRITIYSNTPKGESLSEYIKRWADGSLKDCK